MKKVLILSVLLISATLTSMAQAGKNFVDTFSVGSNIDKYSNFVQKANPEIPAKYSDFLLKFDKDGKWVNMNQQMWTVTDRTMLDVNGLKLNDIYLFTLDNVIYGIAYTAPVENRQAIYNSLFAEYGKPTFTAMTFGRIYGWSTPEQLVEYNYSGTVDGVVVSVIDTKIVEGQLK